MDVPPDQILSRAAVSKLLLFPRRIPESALQFFAQCEVVRIPVGADTLGAMLHAPMPERPLILFFHGNGEVMTDYFVGYHAKAAAAGANLLVVDYRGYGISTGSPSLGNLLDDARAAWKHVVGPMGFEPRRVVIMGRSMGSLAAIEASAESRGAAGGLVIESGISRLDSWVSHMRFWLAGAGVDLDSLGSALARTFDHERKIRSYPGPLLVMHAPFDEIVPVKNAYELASWGDPSRTTLKVFPVGTHNDIYFVNEREYFRTLGEFVASIGS